MRFLSLVILVVLCANSATWAGDGLVALQTADPSCPDDSGDIYVNCGNGTVTDNRTGLVWLANANCIGAVDWYLAMGFVAGLSPISSPALAGCGLDDGSSPGEWRMPSFEEWKTMVSTAVGLGCTFPAITLDSGLSCLDSCTGVPGCSFVGVQSDTYWSSTTSQTLPTFAFTASLDGGDTSGSKSRKVDGSGFVWPVRVGQ